MWARRALGNIGNYPIRAISTSGGALFGSALFGSIKEEKPSWRIEYPKLVLEHGGQLSRKIINEEDKTQLGLRLYQYQVFDFHEIAVEYINICYFRLVHIVARFELC